MYRLMLNACGTTMSDRALTADTPPLEVSIGQPCSLNPVMRRSTQPKKAPRTPTPTLNQPYDKLALKQFEDLLASCALEEAESSVSQAFRIVEPSSARVSVVLYLVVSGSRT